MTFLDRLNARVGDSVSGAAGPLSFGSGSRPGGSFRLVGAIPCVRGAMGGANNSGWGLHGAPPQRGTQP